MEGGLQQATAAPIFPLTAHAVVFEERKCLRRPQVGELPTPTPALGEVRVKLATSGVNPSDVKSRSGRPLGSDRIVPHSDGAGWSAMRSTPALAGSKGRVAAAPSTPAARAWQRQ